MYRVHHRDQLYDSKNIPSTIAQQLFQMVYTLLGILQLLGYTGGPAGTARDWRCLSWLLIFLRIGKTYIHPRRIDYSTE
jgi:hypothetical protein